MWMPPALRQGDTSGDRTLKIKFFSDSITRNLTLFTKFLFHLCILIMSAFIYSAMLVFLLLIKSILPVI